VDESIDTETKRIKVEHSIHDSPNGVCGVVRNDQPNFVSAASLVTPLPEISDAELLQHTLDFEREHGISSSIE
jgi:hypothetical protein